MLICLAAPRPATAELVQIRNADLNLIDLARSTHPPTTAAIRSRTSISPLDRLASTHMPSPRRSNPHSARGTRHTFPSRGFLPWRFSDAGPHSPRHRQSLGRHPKTLYGAYRCQIKSRHTSESFCHVTRLH